MEEEKLQNMAGKIKSTAFEKLSDLFGLEKNIQPYSDTTAALKSQSVRDYCDQVIN